MAKKDSKINIIEQEITKTLEINYMPYTMSVIVSRAIPEIDGFKPAHRKLLYTMYKMGLLNSDRRKSADVVGQTMQLNPHGDGAIYETLVRLTRGYDALLHPFIDSKGNFGKVYSRDTSYAASRYTEVKLAKICNELFRDIDKNTVDFIDNYNGELKEPILFPTTFPNLLVTANKGIAVGMASNICSFNLREVCNATIAYLKNPNVDLHEHLLAPDFSTGGELIYNKAELDKIYETGRGSFKVRGKWRFDKKNSCIEIYEIPYTTTGEAIIDKIILLVKAGKMREVTDVRDETDLKGLKIAIDIKRNADPDMVMHKVINMTTMQDTFSCNFNILIDRKPRTMGVREIIDEWVKFRTGCIIRQVKYDIVKKQEKLHLLTGLAKIVVDIDRAIAIIRNTEEDSMVIPNLMQGFDVEQNQAEYIAEIKLRNLNKEYLLSRISEKEKLEKELAELNDIINNEKKVHNLIIKDLKEVSKKYGADRRTDIVYEEEVKVISEDAFIDDYGLKVFLTQQNYFKKISLVSLRSASEHNLKENDKIIAEIETTNKTDLLFFSNKHNVYKQKAYEMPDCKASSLGDYLPNLLKMEEGEQIIYIAATTDYKGFMVFGFKGGKIAKITMDSYSTKVNRKKLINAYGNKDELIFVDYILEDRDYVAIRDTDKAVLFSTELITPKSTKNSAGIQVYKLKKNSTVSMIIKPEEFQAENIEYYRSLKIPSTGHFITEADKLKNQMDSQIQLF